MPGQLARLFGFVSLLHRSGPIVGGPFESCLSDEISEYDGVLLVRLGAGCVMQVRLRARLASCVHAWIQSNAAIWRWLVAKVSM